jgi:hypothetical protein
VAAPGSTPCVSPTTGGRTQPFEVWKDSTLTSTDADLVAGTDLQVKVVAAINTVVNRINRIEIMRAQVEDLRKAHASDAALDQALGAIGKQMYEAELHYLSRTEMHSDDKWYVEKARIYMNLTWIAAEIGSGGGDVAGGLAYRPTNAAVGAFGDQLKEMAAGQAAFDKLMADVAAFNKKFAGRIAAITDKVPGA